jgi:hypothetical protein
LAVAGTACTQQGSAASLAEQCSREQFSLLLQELEPELSSLRATDQYPSSVHFAVKAEAVDDCTFVVSRAVGAREGGNEVSGEGGGSAIAVEAWWSSSSPVQRVLARPSSLPLPLPLPLGAVLSLAGDVFTHWSEQVVGEEPFSRCRAVDMHTSLLDGMFAAPSAGGAEEGAWDELGDVESVTTEDGDADAVTLLRRHRRTAIKLLQFREYLEVRRRHLSWAVLVTPRGVAVPPQPAGGNYRLRQSDGQLERDEPDGSVGGERIVTLRLPSGATYRAFPSTLPADDDTIGSSPLRYSLLRGVFPDRTHVNVYLEGDVSRGVPARTVRVLLPDASEHSFPLSAFVNEEPMAAASSSGRSSGGSSAGGMDAASLYPQVTALLSFHRWACAPPPQREALMAKMQTMASMVLEAGARNRRHLSVEKLRSGPGSGSGSGSPHTPDTPPPSPSLYAGAFIVSSPPSSFPVLAPTNLNINTPPPFVASKTNLSTPPLASACSDRVREALRACQQALQENAKILTT